MMGGQTGVADHSKISARAAKNGVMRDVEAGAVVGGFPAVAIKAWHGQTLVLSKKHA